MALGEKRFQPGRKKTGGRAPGSKNKASVAREKEVAAGGLTPLQFMLQVMRDESEAIDIRLEAAKSAAPYVHPKLAIIKHTNKDGEPLLISHGIADAFTSRISRLVARAGEDEGDQESDA